MALVLGSYLPILGTQVIMGNFRFFFYHAAVGALILNHAGAASGGSLLGTLLRPFDALNLHSALSPSNVLSGEVRGAGPEQRSFLPKPGDMSLLDSANTLELLSKFRQTRPSLAAYFPPRATSFSGRRLTIVSALFGDDAADQKLRETFGPVSKQDSCPQQRIRVDSCNI